MTTQSSGPRLLYSFECILTCLDGLQHLNTEPAFHGLGEDEKHEQLKSVLTGLLHAVKHPSEHLQQLNTHFSQLLPGALKRQPGKVSLHHVTGGNSLADNARQLLSRFPDVPQKLFTLPFNNSGLTSKPNTAWDSIKDGRWAEKYVVPEARSMFRLPGQDNPESVFQLVLDMQNHAWDNLFVTTFIDTNNCVFLLKIAELGHQPNLEFAQSFGRYIDALGELIDLYESLVDAAKFGFKAAFEDPSPSTQALKAALFPLVTDDEHASSVLKVFLWSAWQRSIMLYFYYVVGVMLWQGSSSTWSSLLAVRGVGRIFELEAQDYRGESCQYLCNWAFELLRTNRTSLALDFRRMIYLFDNHFHELEGRCVKNSQLTCKGDLPESCHRFTDSETKSQSFHATNCDGNCARIRWSETSYRNCENPRAVKVSADVDLLRYCKASSSTMAISHVWSHGQGGRPEDGINLCLHKRYSSLAKFFDCDSYWIDSTCIPDDRQLRKEAIMTINDIFCDSKITLISDKDLQTKELRSRSTEDLETLLSILLVCDWGVRAWTMLEAMRGSKSIFILCAGDQTIPLVDILQMVHSEGAVDLAVLLGSAQHLLPSTDPGSMKPIEEVGHLLSQRHVSREHDVIRIWGLLSILKPPQDILQLWDSSQHVNTAFLLSSAPRVKNQVGYGWAPVTPYIRPQRREVPLDENRMHVYNVRYPSYDGRGSYRARITPHGLRGLWLVHDLDQELITKLFASCVEEMAITWPRDSSDGEDSEFDQGSKVFTSPDYANACYTLKTLLSSTPGSKVRIIKPVSRDGESPYSGNVDRGDYDAILVAVCVCAESKPVSDCSENSAYGACEQWHWKGVYQWDDPDHSDWTVKEMLIV
ncbi:MAG: hypothetical protein Q9195_006619 [Heterodermia aff. obscurata]